VGSWKFLIVRSSIGNRFSVVMEHLAFLGISGALQLQSTCVGGFPGFVWSFLHQITDSAVIDSFNIYGISSSTENMCSQLNHNLAIKLI
jgi:hypothetical protein